KLVCSKFIGVVVQFWMLAGDCLVYISQNNAILALAVGERFVTAVRERFAGGKILQRLRHLTLGGIEAEQFGINRLRLVDMAGGGEGLAVSHREVVVAGRVLEQDFVGEAGGARPLVR